MKANRFDLMHDLEQLLTMLWGVPVIYDPPGFYIHLEHCSIPLTMEGVSCRLKETQDSLRETIGDVDEWVLKLANIMTEEQEATAS